MAELRPILAIEYGGGLPLPIQVTGNIPIRRFQVVDEKQVNKIIREMPPAATVIIDTEAFHGHGSLTARKYVQAIREAHKEQPLILFLRYGVPSDDIIENDRLAGATDVLYHSAVTETSDVRRMNHFIREGVLPPPPEKKKLAGNTAGAINALNRHANDVSESLDDNDRRPFPVSRKEPLGIVRKGYSGAVQTTHQELPPASKSILQRIMAPTDPETPAIGEQEMKALLVAFETLIGQNAQVLATLGKIQDGIDNLRADREIALLAQMREKVSTAMNTAFAQLQQGGEASSAIAPASTDVSIGSAPTATAGVKDALAPNAAPEKKEPIAVLTKHGWSGAVVLFNKTVDLPYGAAELFTHLVNTRETLSTTDIATLYKLGKQGGYFRMSKLLEGLDAFRKGLSSCLTLVQSGNSKNYRFDEAEFCRILKVK
jgi:hypothetical protein